MTQRFILFFGFILMTGLWIGHFQNKHQNQVFCSWVRCPYYEAPLDECHQYSELIPTRMVRDIIQDTEEGLILASECSSIE